MPAQHLCGVQEVNGALQGVWEAPEFRAVSSSGWGGDDKEVNHFSYLKQVIYPGK